MSERRFAVGQTLLDVEAPYELESTFESGLIVFELDIPLDAPEEIGCKHAVSHRAETFGHCP
jgi:hypothetical protein